MAEEYVELVSVDGRPVAELIKSYFEAHGIPVELSQESYGSTLGVTVAPLGKVHLLVPSGRLSEAQDLLQQYFDEEPDR